MPRERAKPDSDPVPPPLHELEAEVMEELWTSGEAPVRAVMDSLNRRASKERAYTTYMTIMARLNKKGLLVRRRERPPHCGPRPDGHLAELPPVLRRTGGWVAPDDAGRRGDAPAHRRRRLASAGASLGEGVRNPVCRRGGLGDDHQLRAGVAVAAVHGVRRRDHRPALLARGRGVFHRGGFRGDLSVRLGSPLPAC